MEEHHSEIKDTEEVKESPESVEKRVGSESIESDNKPSHEQEKTSPSHDSTDATSDESSESNPDLEKSIHQTNMNSPEVQGSEISSEEEMKIKTNQDSAETREYHNHDVVPEQTQNSIEADDMGTAPDKEAVERSRETDETKESVSTYENENVEKKIETVRESLKDVDSYDKLQERLAHPYHETHTKTQVSYQKDLESAKKYYDFLDEMAKGGTIREVSERVGISQPSGSRYLEGRIPRLIQRAIEPIPEQYQKEIDERYRIDTPEKYERALERHSFVKDLPDFTELDHEARVYTQLMGMKGRGELPDKMVKDLAEEYGVGKQRMASWLSERKTQELVHRLEVYEQARESREAKLAKEAFEHRIDPSTVYENFRHLRDVKNPSSDELAESLEKLLKSSGLNTKVQWAELKEYHYGGPKWLRDVATKIAENRETVESALNQRMGLDKNPDEMIRLGVLDSKVYLRRADTSEWNWLNIYKNEAFHFKNLEQKNQLVNETKARLDVSGAKRLSDLVDQMTEYQRVRVDGRPNYDLNSKTPYLKGETLNLSLDTTEKRIQEIQDKIERIGQSRNDIGGVKNPQFFASEKEIKSMFTSVLGAGFSDGHIERSSNGFVYTESNRDRVDIVNEQIDRFGDVYRSEDIRPNGVIRTRYASVYGRALEQRGLTKGDKSIRNEGFPDWLKEASPEELRGYYGPMWAQDGNFYIDPEGRARFQVDRAVVLRDPSKEATYEHQQLATKEHADLVYKFGTPKEGGDFKGLRELSFGDLKELKFHDDEKIAQTARSLEEKVEYTKSELLRDEREGLASMGVMTNPYISRFTYSEKTGRLSVLHHVSTATNDDAMRVAFLCPPEDVRKLANVRDWMKSQDERRERIRNQLESEGLLKGDELNDN